MVTDRQLCTRTIPFNKRLITSYKSSDVIAANYLHIGVLNRGKIEKLVSLRGWWSNSRSNFETISNESRLNGELKKLEGGILCNKLYHVASLFLFLSFSFFWGKGEGRLKWLLRVVRVKDDGCWFTLKIKGNEGWRRKDINQTRVSRRKGYSIISPAYKTSASN